MDPRMSIIGFLRFDCCGMREEDPEFASLMMAEYFAELRRQDWVDWANALLMVLTTMRGDCEWRWPREEWSWDDICDLGRIIRWKAGCLLALLFWREGISDAYPFRHPLYHHNTVDMGHWNLSHYYGGWSCMVLEYHPAQRRFHIYSEGDSSL